jgi:hypothetical protein
MEPHFMGTCTENLENIDDQMEILQTGFINGIAGNDPREINRGEADGMVFEDN